MRSPLASLRPLGPFRQQYNVRSNKAQERVEAKELAEEGLENIRAQSSKSEPDGSEILDSAFNAIDIYYDDIYDTKATKKRNPESVAAGAIYLGGIANSKRIPQKILAEEFDIAANTVSESYKEILDNMKKDVWKL